MPGWLVIVHVEPGQIKSAELNFASGSFSDMLERLESLGFAEALCSWGGGLL